MLGATWPQGAREGPAGETWVGRGPEEGRKLGVGGRAEESDGGETRKCQQLLGQRAKELGCDPEGSGNH